MHEVLRNVRVYLCKLCDIFHIVSKEVYRIFLKRVGLDNIYMMEISTLELRKRKILFYSISSQEADISLAKLVNFGKEVSRGFPEGVHIQIYIYIRSKCTIVL